MEQTKHGMQMYANTKVLVNQVNYGLGKGAMIAFANRMGFHPTHVMSQQCFGIWTFGTKQEAVQFINAIRGVQDANISRFPLSAN